MSPTKSKKSPNHPEEIHADDLPSSREGPSLKQVSAPLANTRLSYLIYFLAILTAIIAAYYSARGLQMKEGDWRMALGLKSGLGRGADDTRATKGDGSESAWRSGRTDSEVRSRVEELAHLVGVPVADLAAGVAGVVASVHARNMGFKSGGAAEDPLVHATRLAEDIGSKSGVGDGDDGPAGGKGTSTGTGFVEGMLSGMEKFVGMEDASEI